MPEILLHQYDSSPFSEKVRVVLGIKGLAWSAVNQPVIMPKPDFVPLTGGYRRIPAMQIGADIYCDSQLIVRELERRYPEPTLFPDGDVGMAQATALWTDRAFFQAAVAVIFGGLGDKVPPAFIKDREALSGRPFDPAAMRSAIPHMTQQLRAHAALICEQLSDGRPFLCGDRPGLKDANAYYNLWFVQAAFPPAMRTFDGLPHLADWMERVRALGHGQRSEVTAAEALKIAWGTEPQAIIGSDHELIGKKVTAAADDYGRDPVAGTLVDVTEFQISIQPDSDDPGQLVVHFPQIGFVLQPT